MVYLKRLKAGIDLYRERKQSHQWFDKGLDLMLLRTEHEQSILVATRKEVPGSEEYVWESPKGEKSYWVHQTNTIPYDVRDSYLAFAVNHDWLDNTVKRRLVPSITIHFSDDASTSVNLEEVVQYQSQPQKKS